MGLCPNCRRAQEAGGRIDQGRLIGPCLGGNCGSNEVRWTNQVRKCEPVRFTLRPGGKQPTRAHKGDAGWDLYTSATCFVKPESKHDIPTSLFIELPSGWWGHLLPRSSTLERYGLQVVSAVIDNDYRGELFVAVYNPTRHVVAVEQGRRLAQLVPHKIAEIEWVEVKSLTKTDRGDGGFGSTGE